MSIVKEKNLTCIVCPRGCSLHVEVEDDGTINVTGNTCKRGAEYAESELTHPTRTLTTTVAVADGSVLSVRTDKPIPKETLFACMNEIKNICVCKSVNFGDVIVADILHTGANLIATGSWNK